MKKVFVLAVSAVLLTLPCFLQSLQAESVSPQMEMETQIIEVDVVEQEELGVGWTKESEFWKGLYISAGVEWRTGGEMHVSGPTHFEYTGARGTMTQKASNNIGSLSADDGVREYADGYVAPGSVTLNGQGIPIPMITTEFGMQDASQLQKGLTGKDVNNISSMFGADIPKEFWDVFIGQATFHGVLYDYEDNYQYSSETWKADLDGFGPTVEVGYVCFQGGGEKLKCDMGLNTGYSYFSWDHTHNFIGLDQELVEHISSMKDEYGVLGAVKWAGGKFDDGDVNFKGFVDPKFPWESPAANINIALPDFENSTLSGGT
ncbi:MAG: hypothetical protein P9M03_06850, partial [Candidatus Theseobacter exili]|nr:hypothetical protein [Candidatus Theseobacter exili]